MAEPNPHPMGRINSPEEVPIYRRVDCQFYELCLNTAVVEGWEGFDCRPCQAYAPLDQTDQRADLEAIARMYNRVHGRDEDDSDAHDEETN